MHVNTEMKIYAYTLCTYKLTPNAWRQHTLKLDAYSYMHVPTHSSLPLYILCCSIAESTESVQPLAIVVITLANL